MSPGFRELLPRGPVVLEVVQPRERGQGTKLHLEELGDALRRAPVDAVNLPEIVPDVPDADAPPRVDVLDYAGVLGRELGVPVLANHVVAHRPPTQVEAWLHRARSEPAVEGVVLVGGARGDVAYPGPSVPDADRLAAGVLGGDDGPAVGNVAIQDRRGRDPDEPRRMVRKAQAGCAFFTTQILYDAAPAVALLEDYARASRAAGVAPRPVLLTFAPVDRPRDVAFLRDLRVRVPEAVERHLLRGDAPPKVVRARSLALAEALWGDVHRALRDRGIPVPVGLNVAHVRWHNLDAAVEMAWRLASAAPPRRDLDLAEASLAMAGAGPR